MADPTVDTSRPADFTGSLHTSDDIPSAATLAKVAEHKVLDRHGKARSFQSLYSGDDAKERTYIIFVRHFFCGMCQQYLGALSNALPAKTVDALSPPTNLIVIGCGDPQLIPMYEEATATPYAIYTDPERLLFRDLGMTSTWAGGAAPKSYPGSALSSTIGGIKQGLGNLFSGLALKGGDFKQVGGEFLFERGDVKWCHRMKTTRDHAELDIVKGVLGVQQEA